MTYQEAVIYSRWYSSVLRRIKRFQMNTEDMPPDTQQSFLACHQRALAAWAIIQEHNREEKYGKTHSAV